MVDNQRQALPDIIDACSFIAQPMEQPAELIKGILHKGSKLVLGGGSKSFKTWTLLDLALSVAHGRPWLNCETTAGNVIYLNFEIQPWSWQKRIQAVASAKGITIEPGRLSLWNLRGRAANFNLILPQNQIRSRRPVVPLMVEELATNDSQPRFERHLARIAGARLLPPPALTRHVLRARLLKPLRKCIHISKLHDPHGRLAGPALGLRRLCTR